MDNLGDWLYIVLLVIAGISGLFSSGKKKRQGSTPPEQPVFDPEQQSEPKGFWEIFEEIQKEKQPQPVPQSVTIEKKKKTQRKDSLSRPSSYQQKTQTEKHPASRQSTRFSETPEDDAFSIQAESFQDTEELRKAIIYSEILNRKY